MPAEWVREIRDQCIAAGVPFFFKQWGGFRPPRTAAPSTAASG
jgi:protein gp37